MDKKVNRSDMHRERFQALRGLLEETPQRTAPWLNDLNDVCCAILYLLKSRYAWRALPGDFQGWATVRYDFDLWTNRDDLGSSLFEQAK